MKRISEIWRAAAVGAVIVATLGGGRAAVWSPETYTDAFMLRDAGGRAVLRYQTDGPADSKLSVESVGYFHPLTTPSGVVVTDVAPPDHPHHRGIFLAWVEMRGTATADFWGWGEPAPKAGRKIVNLGVGSVDVVRGVATFVATNEWRAGEAVLLRETLRVRFYREARAHVLELSYTLAPDSDVTVARWAFSGFCVRSRKDGSAVFESPSGTVHLPNPKHTEPDSDWPDAGWYAARLRLETGEEAGVAVVNHPSNPATRWHNHRDIRMLNPCVSAVGPWVLRGGQSTVLRYTVVAYDGPTPRGLLDRLAKGPR